jgi:hypothetical protein
VPDLVLVEMNVGRPSARGLIEGESELVKADLDRVLIKTVNQVGNCISNLLSGTAQIPTLDIANVRQIWPIVVSNARLVQTPLLWDYIRSSGDPDKTRVLYEDARVQPLTLMDAEDFEQLCGLIEAGTTAPQILAMKTQEQWRERDFAIWLKQDPDAPSDRVRASLVEDIYNRGMERVQEGIDFAVGVQPEPEQPDLD